MLDDTQRCFDKQELENKLLPTGDIHLDIYNKSHNPIVNYFNNVVSKHDVFEEE